MLQRFDDTALVLAVSRVKIILNAIIGATWQLFGYIGPPIPKLLVQVKNSLLFVLVDRGLFYERIQVVMPPIIVSTINRIILSDYLSRHCLPVLPDILNLSFNLWATNVHLFVPYSVTSHKMASSSYPKHSA